MENMELLTPLERGWVNYHMTLATTREWEIAAFSKLFMQEVKAVEPVKMVPKDVRKKLTLTEIMNQGLTVKGTVHYETVVHEFDDFGDCICDACQDEENARADFERRELMAYCRPASGEDYRAWLRGFKAKGGKPTQIQDHEFVRGHWHVLMAQPAYIPELYGADSVNLIVHDSVDLSPSDLRRTFHGKSGHNSIYFMRNFEHVSSHVPVYKDVQ